MVQVLSMHFSFSSLNENKWIGIYANRDNSMFETDKPFFFQKWEKVTWAMDRWAIRNSPRAVLGCSSCIHPDGQIFPVGQAHSRAGPIRGESIPKRTYLLGDLSLWEKSRTALLAIWIAKRLFGSAPSNRSGCLVSGLLLPSMEQSGHKALGLVLSLQKVHEAQLSF